MKTVSFPRTEHSLQRERVYPPVTVDVMYSCFQVILDILGGWEDCWSVVERGGGVLDEGEYRSG